MLASILGFLPWIIVAAGCWLGYQLVKQNGRILLQLEALQQQMAQLSATASAAPHAVPPENPSLPAGSPAPVFDLPSLEHGRVSLAAYRGRRVLLTFFSPTCGFCQQMAPQLAQLPIEAANGHPLPVVLTSGDPEENRRFFQKHGIKVPVGLQEGMEVATQYRVNGTPMGYLIDEEGKIASSVAVGAQAILDLAHTPTAPASPSSANGNGHKKPYGGNKPLSESRINRNGLQPGVPAPNFSLPKVGGGKVSLADFRGRQVLVVFSDPGCGPCMELAPQLETLQRERRDPKILMISRGEAAANEAKVMQHGLTFPIVLQRHWEISKDYAMFGTPIGYLIDAQGKIAAPPASGSQAILDLASSAAQVR